MGGIRTIMIQDREVIIQDYSGLKEDQMIALVTELKELLISKNAPQLIVSVYDRHNFATPRFMNHVRHETAGVIHFINKLALVGLSNTQKLLLKGYNFLFKRNFKSFDSLESALAFLVDESTTDRDFPDYLKKSF